MTSSSRIGRSIVDRSRTLRSALLIAAVSLASFASKSPAEEYYGAWLQRYLVDSGVSQGGVATAVDSRGNVAVTGYTYISNHKVYYTAKYEGATGLLIWQRLYDSGFGESTARSVAMDSAGNVIVTGSSEGDGTGLDYLTIKYNSVTGNPSWAQPLRYNGPVGGADEAYKVLVDDSDNIIVTGRSTGDGTNYDICTIKYSPLGATVWAQPARYNSPSNRADRPASMVLDGSSNTIIVGEADEGSTTKFVTLKYASATGALSWAPALYTPPGATSFYGGTGVAVDPAGNIYTTGISTQANSRRLYHLIKYSSAGGFLWQRTGLNDIDSPASSPVYVGSDTEGNAIVSCTSEDINGNVTIETVKHRASDGDVRWSVRSPAPGGDDAVRGQIVDGASNTILIGESNNENSNLDYYVAKYSSEGDLLYQGWYNGDFGGTGGTDIPHGIAVDGNSNTVIVGESTADLNGSGRQRMVTIKLNRFLAITGDEVRGTDIEDAKFASIGVPAISGTGAVAARVSVASGRKKLGAIFAQGAAGDTTLPAVQGEPVPGISGAVFKSFLDPVVAPNGRYAFIAKLGGVNSSESTSVWTNLSGFLQLVLRQGSEIAGLGSGVSLKSVTSISMRDSSVVALIGVTGPDITKANDTVLLRWSLAGNRALLQTGQRLVAADPDTAIVKFTALAPAKGSPGHGRWHTDNRAIARVELANKQTAVVAVALTDGAVTPLLSSDAAAPGLGVWQDFGLPAVGGTSGVYAALGKLVRGEDGVTPANDTALVYSANGSSFTAFAVEGDDAPGTSDVTYGGFQDPLVNSSGRVAFVANLKGKNVKGANSALYFGQPGALEKVARTGDPAPDDIGETGDARWTSFLSVALPSGSGAGPIFLAKLGGQGVNGKNNLGVWALNSTGDEVRQLIRTGTQLGQRTVARLALLQALPGSFGAARSYNARGSISVLVTFTDKSQAIVNLGIP